jgi:hypothetical protein
MPVSSKALCAVGAATKLLVSLAKWTMKDFMSMSCALQVQVRGAQRTYSTTNFQPNSPDEFVWARRCLSSHEYDQADGGSVI